MARILFVDDEREVLEGIKNVLRKRRHVWDMCFATSGAEAIAMLAEQTFDTVVSDMRMPGMNGAELLARVKDLSPSTVRIILSGHAEQDAVLRAVIIAHQYVPKPCEAATLLRVLDRAVQVRAVICDEELRARIGRFDVIPSPPSIYFRLGEAIVDPTSSLDSVTDIAASDPGIAARLLQVVNSALFGAIQPVTSVRQAVARLGLDTLSRLLVTSEVLTAGEQSAMGRGVACEAIRAHSLLTARIAQRIAGSNKAGEMAFTAGLLHDVGKLILAASSPESFARVLEAGAMGSAAELDCELREFKVSHSTVGAYFLGLWGLPLEIVEAQAFHHLPGLVTAAGLDTLAVVHLADVLSHGDRDLDMEYVAALGATDRVASWRAIASEERLAADRNR